jgi:hypothetical protein
VDAPLPEKKNAAANDYAGQVDKLRPEFLRALEQPKLASALVEWPDRPELPSNPALLAFLLC